MTQQNSPIRLAINGFGRIGRNVLRAYLQRLDTLCERVQIVAINDVWDADTLLHLLKFDSTHGRLSATGVQASVRSDVSGAVLTLTKDAKTIEILLLNQKNPSDLPWQDLRIDVVLECTGHFRSYRAANLHRIAGAKQVIIGAAPFDEVDASIVMGVNDDGLSRALPIISGVSCTTQALVPLLSVLHEAFGIDGVMMTEIHAVTADQSVLDQTHRDLRRARAAGHNIIPTTSSSINATERVLPFMKGKIDGHSIRVPTINVAAIDVTCVLGVDAGIDDVKAAIYKASRGKLAGILGYTDEPLVSADFIGDAHSLVVDGLQFMKVGKQVKIFAWYDNEWGYANRLLDMCEKLAVCG